jgi:hypothetical protein
LRVQQVGAFGIPIADLDHGQPALVVRVPKPLLKTKTINRLRWQIPAKSGRIRNPRATKTMTIAERNSERIEYFRHF